jgi:hypothetical protein
MNTVRMSFHRAESQLTIPRSNLSGTVPPSMSDVFRNIDNVIEGSDGARSALVRLNAARK